MDDPLPARALAAALKMEIAKPYFPMEKLLRS